MLTAISFFLDYSASFRIINQKEKACKAHTSREREREREKKGHGSDIAPIRENNKPKG